LKERVWMRRRECDGAGVHVKVREDERSKEGVGRASERERVRKGVGERARERATEGVGERAR